MEDLISFFVLIGVCLCRLVLVPLLILLSLLAVGIVKAWTWLRTGGKTIVVLLWIPPWRRRRFGELLRSAGGETTARPGTGVLADVLSFDPRGWAVAARILGYRVPRPEEPLCPPTTNPTAWLQNLLSRGARWMIFEQDYVPEGGKALLRILDREDRGPQGTIFIGDLYGIRCELRDASSLDGTSSSVNVGDSLLVGVAEFRGRSSSVRLLAREGGDPDVFLRPARRPFMVVANPWVYLELAAATLNGSTVLRIEELRLPAARELPGPMRVLHRLVVRSGSRLDPRPFIVLGGEAPPVAVCGPVPRGYPTRPEFRRPKQFTVKAALCALAETVNVLRSNRSVHARLWQELRTGSVSCGPGSLLRFVCLEDRPGAEPSQFWAFCVGESLLHYRGGPTGPATSLLVSDRALTNARGETYYWAEPWIAAEPTSVEDKTAIWWAKHVSAATAERGVFDRYARELDDYVFVLEQGTAGGSEILRLIPLEADRPPQPGGELVVRVSGPVDLQNGDRVRLYDGDQANVAAAAVTQVRGRRLWLKVKWVTPKADRIRFLMADPDDVPARVQRGAITHIRADRSSGNNVAANLLSTGRRWCGLPWFRATPRSLWNQRLKDNQSLLAALSLALDGWARVTMVQGPPGTGKTTFITELILQLVLHHHKKVLLVSQSNLATDEALERVARATDRILTVRVGDRDKIAQPVRDLHYDWTDPETRAALRGRLAAKGLATLARVWDTGGMLSLVRDEAVAEAEAAGERAEWERIAAHVDLVCATCIGIGTGRAFPFADRTYDVVILDEASRATQAEAIVPLRLGRRWVLVGDQNQLPPTVPREVRASLAAAGVNPGYASVSLFELLQGGKEADGLTEAPFRVMPSRRTMLATQYRMHPAIAGLVADVFYGGAPIESAGDALGRGLPLPPFEAPICVIDSREWPRRGDRPFADFPLNEEVPSTRRETANSLANPLEVRLVVDVVRALATGSANLPRELLGQIHTKQGPEAGRISFAVITPYREQVIRLREALGGVREWGLLLNDDDSVATVDSYQGKERDIVIVSTVRTARGERANLEFLEDVRRLNVAFSRARHKLILIGDGATLERADRGIMTEHGKVVFERFLSGVFRKDNLTRVWTVPPAAEDRAAAGAR